MWSNTNSYALLVRMQSDTVTLEDSLAVSYKIKHTINILSSNSVHWYISKWIEKSCQHKNLHKDIYSSFIHNHQTWKQPRGLSVGKWINKLVYPENEILFIAKTKQNKQTKNTRAIEPWKDTEEI